MMHKLCAKNWALAMQLLLQKEHFTDKVAAFGEVICSVLVQSGLLETVQTMDGDGFTVTAIILYMEVPV